MNELTRKRLYNQAFTLLTRAQTLLQRARVKHEQRVATQRKKAA